VRRSRITIIGRARYTGALGARVRELPITPEAIKAAMAEA